MLTCELRHQTGSDQCARLLRWIASEVSTELLTEYLRPDRHPTEPWVLAALYSTSIVVGVRTSILCVQVCSDTSDVCVLRRRQSVSVLWFSLAQDLCTDQSGVFCKKRGRLVH